jgi:predicted phosphodiesterase
MMKVAVISDIHGNRQAFESVLDAVAQSDADELWCLGDLVGYGADPDACVELARRHAAVCLAGNHDLAAIGAVPLAAFSRGAGISVQWTREVMHPANLEFLAGLRPQGQESTVGLYHASPRDPVWEYVLSALLAGLCLDEQRERVCLIGHSHVALAFARSAGEIATGEPRRAAARLIGAAAWVRSMTMRVTRLLLAALLGVGAAVLAACGGTGNGLIPTGNASYLESDFQAVAQAALQGSGSCAATESAIEKTERDLRSLPSSVNAGLRRHLQEGTTNLATRARKVCAQPIGESTTTTGTTSTEKTTTAKTAPAKTTPSTTPETSTQESEPSSTTETQSTAPTGTATTPSATTPTGGGVQAPGGENEAGTEGAQGRGPNGNGPPGHGGEGGGTGVEQ